MVDAADPGPIGERLATGLAKIGLAIKHQHRASSSEADLSPTQAQILVALMDKGHGISELARLVGVGVATISESVTTLEAKGLVNRRRHPSDRRAVVVETTDEGDRRITEIAGWPDFLIQAIDQLTPEQQMTLLGATVALIRTLQEQGQIPVARMCVSCTYFRPNVHDDALRPHHCAFVDAAFGDHEIRVDCRDFVPASAPTA